MTWVFVKVFLEAARILRPGVKELIFILRDSAILLWHDLFSANSRFAMPQAAGSKQARR